MNPTYVDNDRWKRQLQRASVQRARGISALRTTTHATSADHTAVTVAGAAVSGDQTSPWSPTARTFPPRIRCCSRHSLIHCPHQDVTGLWAVNHPLGRRAYPEINAAVMPTVSRRRGHTWELTPLATARVYHVSSRYRQAFTLPDVNGVTAVAVVKPKRADITVVGTPVSDIRPLASSGCSVSARYRLHQWSIARNGTLQTLGRPFLKDRRPS